MLLPALGKAKSKAQGILCMNNGKQLMLGWTLYSGDNRDEICLSAGLGGLVNAVCQSMKSGHCFATQPGPTPASIRKSPTLLV